MKREEEIKKAAKIAVINSVDWGMDEETAWIYGFFHGARWSDENPVALEKLKEMQRKLDELNSRLGDEEFD